MGRMRSIASAWIYNGEYHDIDVELNRFESVSLEDIRKVLERFPALRDSEDSSQLSVCRSRSLCIRLRN